MTIYVIATTKKLQTIPNVYVANLAVADLLLLCVNLPTTIMEFFTGSQNAADNIYCR